MKIFLFLAFAVFVSISNSFAQTAKSVAPFPASTPAVQESGKRAVSAYPDLAKPDSSQTQKYRALYNAWLAARDPRLAQPDWPEQLARLSAPAQLVSAAPAEINETLPDGRTIHFQSAEQRDKFLAGLNRQQAQREAAKVQAFNQAKAKPVEMGHTALDQAPPAIGRRATICGRVFQKVPAGLLVRCAEFDFERQSIPGALRGVVSGAPRAVGTVLLKGFPNADSMADDDPLGNVVAQEAGTFSLDPETVRAYQYITGR